MVADKLSPSASVVVIDVKGCIVALSFTVCPEEVPAITGAVFEGTAAVTINSSNTKPPNIGEAGVITNSSISEKEPVVGLVKSTIIDEL